MNIRTVIEIHFEELASLVKQSDVPVYCGLMTDDILQNCFLTAINKYKENDVDEITALEYLRRNISNEIKFSYRRKERDKLVFVENVIAYDKAEE